MKKNCTSMTTKLVFTVCFMLDIARYPNQSGIALRCAAIPVNTPLGIAGAASFVTSMSRAFGVPTTQYGRNRRNYRFGEHGEEEGTFTTRTCAVSCELLYLLVRFHALFCPLIFCFNRTTYMDGGNDRGEEIGRAWRLSFNCLKASNSCRESSQRN